MLIRIYTDLHEAIRRKNINSEQQEAIIHELMNNQYPYIEIVMEMNNFHTAVVPTTPPAIVLEPNMLCVLKEQLPVQLRNSLHEVCFQCFVFNLSIF